MLKRLIYPLLLSFKIVGLLVVMSMACGLVLFIFAPLDEDGSEGRHLVTGSSVAGTSGGATSRDSKGSFKAAFEAPGHRASPIPGQ